MRLITGILLATTGALSAFSPVLNLVDPRGGQRGTEIEVHFYGDRLDKIDGALFYEPGLTLSGIVAKDAKHLVAKLAIAPDAALGEHSLRLKGPDGLSELRSFWVGQFPTVAEVEPNATFETAQREELNSTVAGVAGNEDDDYYVCTLKKGQRLSVEVEAMRLGRTMFDAYVAILDPKKFELAARDDTPLLRNDAFVSVIAPEDGDYRVLVHEAAYEGNDQCQYRLHIGTFPRPAAVFPPGGKPGETVKFTFIGDPLGPIEQTITLPATPSPAFPVFAERDGFSAPSPNWVAVSPLECVTANPTPPVPFAIHGILDGDKKSADYEFSAKKGQNLVLRVLARSLRSPLDSVLSVRDAKGKSLASNDDQGSPDSIVNWTCPEDGAYKLRISDQLGRTGPDFTYRIEVAEKAPSIAANLPTVERVNTQKWKTFPVPRGNRYAAVVNVVRENTNCAASLEATGLPAGIAMHAPPVAKGISSFPVVFEAAADAPVAAELAAFTLRSTGDGPQLAGPLTDTINHVEINNQGVYHSVTVDRIATAVTTEAPFRIDLDPPAVPLPRNGTLALKVRVVRNVDYKEKIVLRFLWSPPGVSAPNTLELAGDKAEISYELNANNDAAVGDWQVCVLAEATTPQGPVLVSSALVPLKVAEPYVSMTLDLAATEQGKNTSMLAKTEILHPFEGAATVELMGLPHGTTCPPQQLTKDQAEITFPVAVAADAAIGKHTTVFCRVSIPENGAAVTQSAAMGGTLRIDAPVVAKADAKPDAKPEPKPADASAAPPKPLSRLEQLRLRAK